MVDEKVGQKEDEVDYDEVEYDEVEHDEVDEIVLGHGLYRSLEMLEYIRNGLLHLMVNSEEKSRWFKENSHVIKDHITFQMKENEGSVGGGLEELIINNP